MALSLEAKALKAADLTFFEWHFHHPSIWGGGSGKQKALNPSKRVLDRAFPAIDSPPSGSSRSSHRPQGRARASPRFRLPTLIYGPGLAAHHSDTRSLTHEDKNWRINGLLKNPVTAPTRYNSLRPGDWVIISLTGRVAPERAVLVFLSAAAGGDDARIIRALEARGAKARKALSVADIDAVVAAAAPPPAHGIHTLLAGVAQPAGGDAVPPPPPGKRLLDTPVYPGRNTPTALDEAQATRQALGNAGEEIVDAYLRERVTAGELTGCKWHSAVVADAPFDFLLDPEGAPSRVDVKATSGLFDAAFYLSVNELKAMLEGVPYIIYRLYEVNAIDKTARLRVSSEMAAWAVTIRKTLRKLPTGVDASNLMLTPNALRGVTWGEELRLRV
jgi:hypothetical protein